MAHSRRTNKTQASAALPENTLASFEAAIRDGAEGIETDVHISRDNILIMFHDPNLARMTGSTGMINEKDWYGEDGIEHVRTVKEPKQSIPTFVETLALLMKVRGNDCWVIRFIMLLLLGRKSACTT